MQKCLLTGNQRDTADGGGNDHAKCPGIRSEKPGDCLRIQKRQDKAD